MLLGSAHIAGWHMFPGEVQHGCDAAHPAHLCKLMFRAQRSDDWACYRPGADGLLGPRSGCWCGRCVAELDAVIVEACQPWAHQIELLQTIPGVGEKVAQVIIAETGGDMARFPTAAHLAAWAGLAPAMNEPAGKQSPAGKRHGNRWLTAILVEAAGSVGRMHGKNYLAVQHARLMKRRGMGRAQVAVAHSMLVSAYWMLKRDEPYHDLGADWHRRRSDEAHARRLVTQLERLGHTVIIDPAA